MGQGYKAQPQGLAKVAADIRDLQRDQARTRTAANIQNSAITGGSGLTVQAADGQKIQLLVSDDGVSRMLFSPPAASQDEDWVSYIAFDPDGSYGGGELFLTSPAAPVSRFDNQPAQSAYMNLTSGDGVTQGATIGIAVSNTAIQIIDAESGNPPTILIGEIGSGACIQDDATSSRLFFGSASLVFPYGTAEVRVRDVNNANYTVIRASAFTVTSTREAKQDIQDFGWSPAGVVAKAKAQKYRYREGTASPEPWHYGPMAEDLPDELVDRTDPDEPGLNAVNLIGVLWGAVGELTKRVADLEARLA